MRTELLALAFAAAVSVARGQAETLSFASAPALFVGAASTLQIDVALPTDAAEPLLLTVLAEGTALDVVRGRLTRSSARSNADGTLAFVVPVLGRAQGSSIVRAHLRFFRCAAACREEEAVAARVVEVRVR